MRHIHVTRADGRPAYVNARPRLRQSHFDALRKMRARFAEMGAQEAELAKVLDQQPDRPATHGIALLLGILAVAVLFSAAF